MAEQAPRRHTIKIQVPAVTTVGNSASYPVKVPEAGVVAGVSYAPTSAQSGANTNSRTLNVINKGQAGAGSTSVASLALVSGTNLAAFVPSTITLSGTAANLVVAAGDVLQVQSLSVGTGIADPGGEFEILIDRTA